VEFVVFLVPLIVLCALGAAVQLKKLGIGFPILRKKGPPFLGS